MLINLNWRSDARLIESKAALHAKATKDDNKPKQTDIDRKTHSQMRCLGIQNALRIIRLARVQTISANLAQV